MCCCASGIAQEVSIHAPTRGATSIRRRFSHSRQFQSTLPHGERLPHCKHRQLQSSFNPRSHTGSDNANANAGVVYSNTNNARSNSNTNNGARLCLINSASWYFAGSFIVAPASVTRWPPQSARDPSLGNSRPPSGKPEHLRARSIMGK